MSATQQAVTLTITLPLPPASLSPNGREFWTVRHRDAQKWREDAARLTRNAIWEGHIDSHPWDVARMDIHWQFAGKQPDDDNVIGRCKAIRDGIADACLVANDSVIRVGAVTFERVRRKDQQVIITLTRIEAA